MATEISEFKNLVAVDVLPCPDPIVNREVVSMLLEFCKKSELLVREFELTIDSNDIDSDLQDSIDFDLSLYATNLRPVSIRELMVDTTEYIPEKRNLQGTLTNWAYIKQAGVKYYWIPANHLIRLFDMATTDTTLYMKAAFKPLRTATQVDDFLFEDWSEAIVAGAKWKILSMPGKEWTDARAAEHYRREWRKALAAAKVVSVKNGTPGDQRMNYQSFGEVE